MPKDEKITKLGDLPFSTSLSDVKSLYSPKQLKPKFSERNRTFHEQNRMNELQRVIRHYRQTFLDRHRCSTPRSELLHTKALTTLHHLGQNGIADVDMGITIIGISKVKVKVIYAYGETSVMSTTTAGN